jgi:hypothetical protein
MIKSIFKWLFRLLFTALALAAVAVIIFLLTYNSLLRLLIERNLRAQTGLDAEIGHFHLALTEPTVEIQNLKIYNSKDFGGTLFLDIPEIHIEYDPAALARHQLHLTLLRFNLGELDIVKNEAGRTNLFLPGLRRPARTAPGTGLAAFQKQTGLNFTGIDVLNVSVGKMKFVDLKNPRQDRAVNLGLENCVMKNVKTPADLTGLAVLVALRGGGFFGSLIHTNL